MYSKKTNSESWKENYNTSGMLAIANQYELLYNASHDWQTLLLAM